VDAGLYLLSAVFAGITAVTSTLAPHRAWGSVAVIGYSAATALVLLAWASRRLSVTQVAWLWQALGRAGLAVGAFVATTLIPIAQQSMERAGGRTDRAQDEVLVIEHGAQRLLDTGSPYLSRAAIAALPEGERLLAYLPYQPGMAVFGVPRAAAGDTAWTDARVWFALGTIAALAGALAVLWRAGVSGDALVRALQVATVLPVCALTLATGGDDLPVLALCLLGFALAATGRFAGAGLAIGAAAALKLFAWPVAVVLGAHALTRGRLGPYAAAAVGIPLVTAIPPLLVNSGAMAENVLAFPFGRGLVSTPAASPLPGHLIATSVPGGRIVVYVLILVVAVGIAVALVRRPPRTVADAAIISGVSLLAAMLLLPATRFGYLLYPVALLVWAAALPKPSTMEEARVATP
jgi:hypothetical protein